MHVVVGSLLLVLGAAGATAVTRTFEERGEARLAVPANAPMGLLMGAGAALLRGWDLVGSMVAGAVIVPFVGAAVRYVEARRRRAGASRDDRHHGPGVGGP